MRRLKKSAGKWRTAPTASEAELAVYRLLITDKPTPKECRMALRLLLREASTYLERSR